MKTIKHEITAIPALLELLDISGAIITIDAMGTQTDTVEQIRHKQAADRAGAQRKSSYPLCSSQELV